MTHRTWVSWSSGKDSTPALAVARADPELEVVGLPVHDGPGFADTLEVRVGDVVERDGFVFADVLPVASGTGPVN